MEKINYERNRSDRNNKSCGFVMSDIDDFKSINDDYGHEARDYILKEIANIFRNTMRKQDCAARWGGEEFLFLLPETELEGV